MGFVGEIYSATGAKKKPPKNLKLDSQIPKFLQTFYAFKEKHHFILQMMSWDCLTYTDVINLFRYMAL